MKTNEQTPSGAQPRLCNREHDAFVRCSYTHWEHMPEHVQKLDIRILVLITDHRDCHSTQTQGRVGREGELGCEDFSFVTEVPHLLFLWLCLLAYVDCCMFSVHTHIWTGRLPAVQTLSS